MNQIIYDIRPPNDHDSQVMYDMKMSGMLQKPENRKIIILFHLLRIPYHFEINIFWMLF